MRLLITFLLVTSSATVFALDPYLTRSSGNMCYYDDGSVINNGGRICPRRLSSNNGTSGITVPNLGPSQESIDWRLNFGKRQAEALSSGLSVQDVLALQQISAASAKQRAERNAKKAAFADYVSSTHGQEGEALRELIMSGVIDSSNYQLFVD
jgi:hypothetical protein